MNCREFLAFLWKYLEEDLPTGERVTFEEHLAECPHCVQYLDSYRRTVELGREAFVAAASDARVPESVPEDLIEAILAAQSAGRR